MVDVAFVEHPVGVLEHLRLEQTDLAGGGLDRPPLVDEAVAQVDECLVAFLHLLGGEVGPRGLYLGENVDDVGAGRARADRLRVRRILVGRVISTGPGCNPAPLR